MTKILGGGGFSVIVVWVLRLMYVQWSKQNPGIEASGASSDVYVMLKAELKELKADTKLLKKQVTLLEHLCLQRGIDVHQAYLDAGIHDDEPPENGK